MKNNFLCRLGIHNWKILKIENDAQLQENLRVEIQSKDCECTRPCFCKIPMRVEYSGCGPIFHKAYYLQKVCRRCETIVDEITPYLKKTRPKVIREIELERIGNETEE